MALYEELKERYPDKELVGWYHTHPRMGIFLSEYDTWLHRNFFPEPYQVALVIEPHSATGGFFIRQPDGSLDPRQYFGFYELYQRNRSQCGALAESCSPRHLWDKGDLSMNRSDETLLLRRAGRDWGGDRLAGQQPARAVLHRQCLPERDRRWRADRLLYRADDRSGRRAVHPQSAPCQLAARLFSGLLGLAGGAIGLPLAEAFFQLLGGQTWARAIGWGLFGLLIGLVASATSGSQIWKGALGGLLGGLLGSLLLDAARALADATRCWVRQPDCCCWALRSAHSSP